MALVSGENYRWLERAPNNKLKEKMLLRKKGFIDINVCEHLEPDLMNLYGTVPIPSARERYAIRDTCVFPLVVNYHPCINKRATTD